MSADLSAQLAEILTERFPDDGAALVADPTAWPDPPEGQPIDFQLGWWAALCMVASMSTTALTSTEHAMVSKIGDLAVDFIELTEDGPNASEDFREILPHLHALQQAVMAQAAARTHPTRYRLLGGTLDA